MAQFRYTIDGENASIEVEAGSDLARLAYDAEKALHSALEKKGLQIDTKDQRYLVERISRAIMRDFLSGEYVDLGSIRVIPIEKPPADTPNTYTLINVKVKDGLTKRNYDPDQSIGAIVADLRRLYNLGLNDNIVIFQVVNGAKREIPPETRVGELASKELHWDISKYD